MVIDEQKCILITPVEELGTLPALKKQIKKIQEIENIPVVFSLPAVSSYRRKSLIENKIPFISARQIYLPFMGTFLNKEQEPKKAIEKFMFSTQQLLLLYLYSKKKDFYVSEATKLLPFTAMTLSRAVKQLETTGLFDVEKDGVNKVIRARYENRELYENAFQYLSSPVRIKGYIPKENITEDMAIAGETALSEKTMLNPGRIVTYAVSAKQFDKTDLINELIEPEKQVCLELWEYSPKQFANGNTADAVSIALSFKDCRDERIEEAVEELLESEWKR